MAASILDHLDAYAEQLLARAAPVRFSVATSEADREAVFRLRFETVVAEGWATPEAMPDGLERDAYDDEAVHVAGWDGPTLAAAARLVFPSPGRLLPTEQAFDLRIEPADAVVDLGRGIVAPGYRDRAHTVFAALLARCWFEMRARGVTQLCGAASEHRVRNYRQLGFPLRVLGPPRAYWGEERYPVYLDTVHLGRALAHRTGLAPPG